MPGFPAPSPVGEIFRFFLRLGLTAFGGPAAHLALMQQESVSPDSLLPSPLRPAFKKISSAPEILPENHR